MTTEEKRLLRAIYRPRHNKTAVKLWTYAEAHPETTLGKVTDRIGDVLDALATRWVQRPGMPRKVKCR